MNKKPSIGVIGGGAWGTALAQLYALDGRNVTIWAREAGVVKSINEKNENESYLAGVILDENLRATSSMQEALACDIILLVTPAQHTRAILKDIDTIKPLVICSKGIEVGSGEILPDIVQNTCPSATPAIMSGPSFASEVARGLPAAVTLACKNKEVGNILQRGLAAKNFRPYLSTDTIGVALGGSLKNVIAIACGIVAGKDLGQSAAAAIMARGLAEMTRLSSACGGKTDTMMGLAGMGDLVLTASSLQSRNYSFGYALGEGQSAEEILQQRNTVTEGAHAASAALTLAKRHGIDMPITSSIAAMTQGTQSVDAVIAALLSRPLKEEK